MRPTPSRVIALAASAILIHGGSAALLEPMQSVEEPDPASHAEPDLQTQMMFLSSLMSRIATDAVDLERSEQALSGIVELQRRLLDTKLETPPRFGDLSESDQRSHDRSYRRAIAELLIEITRLEVSVLDADAEEAMASLDRISALKVDGHKVFQEPRERHESPRADLKDELDLSPRQLKRYAGFFEVAGLGFRMGVVFREGSLYLDTFGQPSERLYSAREHVFQIGAMPGIDMEFELDDAGRATAILLHTGRGPAPQRVERVY